MSRLNHRLNSPVMRIRSWRADIRLRANPTPEGKERNCSTSAKNSAQHIMLMLYLEMACNMFFFPHFLLFKLLKCSQTHVDLEVYLYLGRMEYRALTALLKVQASIYLRTFPRTDLFVLSICPGFQKEDGCLLNVSFPWKGFYLEYTIYK